MENKTTPNKNTPDKKLPGFTPLSLPEKLSKPTKQNLTGLPRVTRDVAIDVHNNVQKWNELHIKGAHIVKKVVEEKANNPGKYTPVLEQCMNELEEVVAEFVPIVNHLKILTVQARAADDLQRKYEALFSSMDAQTMAELIEMMTYFYAEEYLEKETVLKNIAHVKTKNEAMFFAACWTLQCHLVDIVSEQLEALLSHLGVRVIE